MREIHHDKRQEFKVDELLVLECTLSIFLACLLLCFIKEIYEFTEMQRFPWFW